VCVCGMGHAMWAADHSPQRATARCLGAEKGVGLLTLFAPLPGLEVLGKKEEALSEGRRAIEMFPIAKNSIAEGYVKRYFVMACAWAGERELALEHLEVVARIPGGPSYGDLRLSPMWDPLRGDPRFEKIVASLAPH
jgi:hypothetical protein